MALVTPQSRRQHSIVVGISPVAVVAAEEPGVAIVSAHACGGGVLSDLCIDIAIKSSGTVPQKKDHAV